MRTSAFAVISILLAGSVSVHAGPPDKRLATAKTAAVVAHDPMTKDRLLAACVADHLEAATPLKLVTDASNADLVLMVDTSFNGDVTRGMTGSLGMGRLWIPDPANPNPKALIFSTAVILDAKPVPANVPCAFADKLLDKLLSAMRKARDAKNK